ncbi:hypothetical protein [Brevundimonas sp.]|uniref:hypothetical protein n=1 Tax=Brevundimonas sp. TaxID=1871086 RepID=UPI003516E5D3
MNIEVVAVFVAVALMLAVVPVLDRISNRPGREWTVFTRPDGRNVMWRKVSGVVEEREMTDEEAEDYEFWRATK